MDEPQILAVLIVIVFFAITFFGGWFLIHRTMNRPDAYIGAKMAKREQEMREAQARTQPPEDGERRDSPPPTGG